MLRIPDEAKLGIELIAQGSDSFIYQLRRFLLSNRAPLSFEGILQHFKKEFRHILSDEECESLFEVLTSLQSILGAEGGLEDEEYLAEQLVETVRDYEDLDLSDEDLARLQSRVTSLMGEETSIALAYKAVLVRNDHKNVFYSARLYTDIRPIFKGLHLESQGSIAGYALIHNLKISFNDIEGRKEFFVALDSEDLELLKDEVQRAIEKELVLEKFMNSTNILNIED